MKAFGVTLALALLCGQGTGTCCSDADGDGFEATVDCDDSDASIFPGAIETCNGLDDDCDGLVDNGACTYQPDCTSLGVDVCDQTPGCRWLASGACGEPALPKSGCYPSDDCLYMNTCPDGTQCITWWVNPCWNEPCDACGQEVGICQ